MIVTAPPTSAQSQPARDAPVPSPARWFGVNPGDDGFVASFSQLHGYIAALAACSDRIYLEQYGEDLESQPLLAATVTARENQIRLQELESIQQALSHDSGMEPSRRSLLAAQAKGIVLVTCGIHGAEMGAPQMVPGLLHHLATDHSAETLHILRECVVIVVPSLNPSGLDLVRDWYFRTRNTPFETTTPPARYQRYAGHDNNRDWIAQTQPETRSTVERLLNRWLPHVVIDLHQMHGTGPRYILPPYLDPFDPNVDPAIQQASAELGDAVAAALADQAKAGVATSVLFDAFSPSRAYAHYHGGVRLLGEAAAAPLSQPVDVHPQLLMALPGYDPHERTSHHPIPWPGGSWGTADVIAYHRSTVLAALQHVAMYRAHWVSRQGEIAIRAATDAREPQAVAFLPETRQFDPSALFTLIRLLQGSGITIETLSENATSTDADIPPGSIIVRFNQPFGSYARTLLLPMGYPGDSPPYDTCSHHLPLLMGVEMQTVDQIDAALISLRPWHEPGVRLPAASPNQNAAFVLSPCRNDARLVVNELLAEGVPVEQLIDAPRSAALRVGSYLVPVNAAPRLGERLAARGIEFGEMAIDRTDVHFRRLQQPRIGLYASWRSNSVDEGWTQFVLESHGFAVDRLRDADIQSGKLHRRCDTIIFASMSASDLILGNNRRYYPEEYCDGIGARGVAQVRDFVTRGGNLILLDQATELATKRLKCGVTEGFMRSNLSAPGSILNLHLDSHHPVAWGYNGNLGVMVTDSPLFESDERDASFDRIGWFDDQEPLLSGWLPDDHQRRGACALAQVQLGKGRITLFGFRPQFRGHSLASFRLLFNAMTQPASFDQR
jgi:hypothetical protein